MTVRFSPINEEIPEVEEGRWQTQLSFLARFAMTDETREEALAGLSYSVDPSIVLDRAAVQAHSSIIIHTTAVAWDPEIAQKITQLQGGIALMYQLGNDRTGIAGVDFVGRTPHFAPINTIDASHSVFTVFQREIEHIELNEERRRRRLRGGRGR